MASDRTHGSPVEAYCGKCSGILAHVVESATRTRIAKVRCSTCEDVHAYRKAAPKSAGAAIAAKAERAAARRRALDTAGFDALTAGCDLEGSQPYDRTESYREEDILEHSVFGAGIVVGKAADGKITVQFRDARRVLVHEIT